MVDIHHEGLCQVPVDAAFAYVDDYRNATKWMFGLAEFSPVGEVEHGLGAVFNGVFQVKPVKLKSVVKVIGWEQDKLIAFDSVKGFPNQSTWRFEALSDAETKLTVEFSYQLPGGIAGRVLGKALEPIVALTVRHTDVALRKQIEDQYAGR